MTCKTLTHYLQGQPDVSVTFSADLLGRITCSFGYWPDEPLVSATGHTVMVAFERTREEWEAEEGAV